MFIQFLLCFFMLHKDLVIRRILLQFPSIPCHTTYEVHQFEQMSPRWVLEYCYHDECWVNYYLLHCGSPTHKSMDLQFHLISCVDCFLMELFQRTGFCVVQFTPSTSNYSIWLQNCYINGQVFALKQQPLVMLAKHMHDAVPSICLLLSEASMVFHHFHSGMYGTGSSSI